MSKFATQLAVLLAAVEAQQSVTESAITLINGLGEQIKEATATLAEAGADTSELVEITNQITTQSEALANAVQANTGAPSPETPVPTPEAPAPEQQNAPEPEPTGEVFNDAPVADGTVVTE